MLVVLVFALLFSIAYAGKVMDVESTDVQELANWALGELKRLSDSGIYSTLSLDKVIAAEEEKGVFHYNTMIDVSLASPHFKSGKPAENFSMVVMKHHEEDYRTIAINEFPDMDEFAIEAFYIQKIERKRAEREEVLSRWEAEQVN